MSNMPYRGEVSTYQGERWREVRGCNWKDDRRMEQEGRRMSDTISRQAAIDALIKWYGYEPSDIGAFENIIDKLPSAQPEITLQAAIDYLHSIGWMQEHDRILTESAQPEQQIPQMRGWVCPVCGRGLSPYTSVCPCNNGKGWEITC